MPKTEIDHNLENVPNCKGYKPYSQKIHIGTRTRNLGHILLFKYQFLSFFKIADQIFFYILSANNHIYSQPEFRPDLDRVFFDPFFS